MAETETLTPAIQEYLESLYWLGEAGIERTPTNLARAMQVSPPSVTGMVRRLESEGLVDRGPGKRIVLTAKGTEVAKHVVSRHRLVEAFLVKVMGVPWDEVHEEAEAFEMGVTPALEARMLDMIGEARTCPHGHPIGDYPRPSRACPDRGHHRQRGPGPALRERGPRPAADVPPGRGRARGPPTPSPASTTSGPGWTAPRARPSCRCTRPGRSRWRSSAPATATPPSATPRASPPPTCSARRTGAGSRIQSRLPYLGGEPPHTDERHQEQALEHLITDTILQYGLLAVFVLMLLESACIPIPSEVNAAVRGGAGQRQLRGQHRPGGPAPQLRGRGLAGTLGNLVGSWIAWGVGCGGGAGR